MKLTAGKKKLIALAVLVAIAIAAYVITMTDTGPPDLSGIKVRYEDIPLNENAFTYFEKAGGLLEDYSDRSGDSVDTVYRNEYNPAAISNQIAQNQAVLHLFQQGLACREMQFPEMEGYMTLLSYLPPMRQVARLQSNRAFLLFMNGRQHDAFNVLIQTHQYGCMIQKGKGGLIHFLVGTAVKAIARIRIREFLQTTTLPPRVLKSYINLLDDNDASVEGISNAIRLEYVLFSSMIDDIESGRMSLKDVEKMLTTFDPDKKVDGEKSSIYRFKPNLTRRMYAETIRVAIDNVDVPCSKMTKIKKKIPRSLRTRISPNKSGKRIHDIMIPAYDRAVEQSGRDRIGIGATRLLIALKCYKMLNGTLPNNLNALVPNYIDSIPLDYYDGKPLRYSRSKRVIYCLGPDLKDSGGPDPSWWRDRPTRTVSWNEEDIGFLINF